MKRYFLPAAVVVVLFLASAFAERPGNFKIIGPGGGGAGCSILPSARMTAIPCLSPAT